MTRPEIIQMAVLAALGCTTINYRSPRKLDESAEQIARFVEAALAEAERRRPEAGYEFVQGYFADQLAEEDRAKAPCPK